MNFDLLTIDELNNIANYYQVSGDIQQIMQFLTTLKFEKDTVMPNELVDLYIAQSLVKSNANVPYLEVPSTFPNYIFVDIAKQIHLNPEDTPDNRTRADRIMRIIRDTKTNNTPIITTTTNQTTIVNKTIPPLIPVVATTQSTSISKISSTPYPTGYQSVKSVIPQSPRRISNLAPTRISTPPIPSPRKFVPRAPSPSKSTKAGQINLLQNQSIQRQNLALTSQIQVIPVIYNQNNMIGDFTWMIERPEYNDVLFIFNDNEEQFLIFHEYLNNGNQNLANDACNAGSGNAQIRPYQCLNPPKAAGIPTGSYNNGVYVDINTAKPYIDASIRYIRQLLRSGLYKRIVYSAGPDGYILGIKEFNPSPDVLNYITQQINDLSNI
jgi:hypothetical protein